MLVKVEYSHTIFWRGIYICKKGIFTIARITIFCVETPFLHSFQPMATTFFCGLSLALPCQEDHLQSAFLVKLKRESNLATLHPGGIFFLSRNFSDGIFASMLDGLVRFTSFD